jgi:Nucleotidyl transferase of unknown function (DUF2204)
MPIVNEPLSTTLADAVAFLESEGISYALIGGLAVSLRGQPRVTVDVDMVIAIDVNRALALLPMLSQSKFEPLFHGVEEVVQKSFILPLRHRTTGIKVDLAIGLSGFERQAVARAERIQIADQKVAVATAEDLLVMKLLAGRPQDEQDITGLIIAKGDKLDWIYCQHVADELGLALGLDLASRVRNLRNDQENST